MPKLFMVYLGGKAPKANIELHDIQFVVGESIDETFDTLKQNWFGTVQGLHLDSYCHVSSADGYQISLSEQPPTDGPHLYFVNIGGYQPENMAELHQFDLFVSDTPNNAKQKALKSLLHNSELQHKDNLYDVDDCLSIQKIGQYYIHLSKSSEQQSKKLKPDWYGYQVIG